MFSLKKAAVLAATGAALVVPATASASTVPMATGSGSSPGGPAQAGGPVPFSFSFNAQNPNAPRGTFTFTRPDGTFTASVTSFTEQGNEAAFTGPIISGTGGFSGDVGNYAYMGVQDNGQGTHQTAPDGIQVDIDSRFQGNSPVYSQVPSWWNWPTAYPYQLNSGTIQLH